MTIPELKQLAADYLAAYPEEADDIRSLQDRLAIDEPFNYRKSFSGHGTGAAIVLSPDKKKILLIHHRGLDKWMQPGGHWDPEEPDPWTAGQREAEEETGVNLAERLHIDPNRPYIPLDIHPHKMPANAKKNEPEHWHYDFRYVFVASNESITPQELEIIDVAWVPLDSDDPRLSHVARCITKLRRFGMLA